MPFSVFLAQDERMRQTKLRSMYPAQRRPARGKPQARTQLNI